MKIDLGLKRFIHVLLFILPVASLKSQSGNIEFIENKGQWDKQIKFQGDVSAGSFFIRKDGGFTVLQHNTDDLARLMAIAIMKHEKQPPLKRINLYYAPILSM